LNFIEQAHILYSDHRLVGEGRCQFNLPVGKWSDSRPHQHDDADRVAFA
jgi:hypothetical protein